MRRHADFDVVAYGRERVVPAAERVLKDVGESDARVDFSTRRRSASANLQKRVIMLSAESIRYSLAADFGLPDSTRLAFPMGPPEGTGAKTLGSSLGTSRNWLGNSLHRLKTTIGPVE